MLRKKESGVRIQESESRPEAGFALLIVFLMAASVALMLYIQLPRVAFESERDKEQTLIDRGEQYKRAIQLFYIANRRFPSTLEELEKLNDKRFLRRRYLDPITGKDEWRLVHTNGAFLTDSLVTKPPDPNKDQLTGNTAGSNVAGAGAPGGPGAQPGGQFGAGQFGAGPAVPGQPGAQNPGELNAAALRRPSDRQLVSQTGFASPAGGFDPNNPADPNASPRDPRQEFLQSIGQAQPNDPNNPQNFPPITLNPQTQNPDPNSFPPITQQTGAGQSFGQPQFGQPQFGQPQFGQPQFGQPQFGQPQFGQQGQGLPGQYPQGFPQQQQQFGGQQGFAPQQPFAGQQPFPGQTGLPGQPGFPGQQAAGTQYRIDPSGQFIPINPAQGLPGQSLQQGQFNTGQFNAGQPAQTPFAGVPAFPPQPVSSQGQFAGGAFPGQQGQPGNFGGAGNPNSALGIINSLLTTPRQPPPGVTTGTGATAGGVGIAGVASTSTGASIKRYKERGKYNEWEFVFDLQQQQQQQNANRPGAPGQPGQPGQPAQPGQPSGTSPFGPSPFGSQPGGLFGPSAPPQVPPQR